MSVVHYSEEIANKICSLISNTDKGLNHICKGEGMPSRSIVYEWLILYPEFSDNYARAKERQADLIFEDIISISDDSSQDEKDTEFGIKENTEFTSRSRLKIDARKWVLSKLQPKKYGDKLDLSTNGKDINTGVTFITEVTTDVRGTDKDNTTTESNT